MPAGVEWLTASVPLYALLVALLLPFSSLAKYADQLVRDRLEGDA